MPPHIHQSLDQVSGRLTISTSRPRGPGPTTARPRHCGIGRAATLPMWSQLPSGEERDDRAGTVVLSALDGCSRLSAISPPALRAALLACLRWSVLALGRTFQDWAAPPVLPPLDGAGPRRKERHSRLYPTDSQASRARNHPCLSRYKRVGIMLDLRICGSRGERALPPPSLTEEVGSFSPR